MDCLVEEHATLTIARVLDVLFGSDQTKELTRDRAERAMYAVAQDVAGYAADKARQSLMTAQDVAAEFGITHRRVVVLAKARGLGWKFSGDWVFTPAEVEAMRHRPVGRPRKPDPLNTPPRRRPGRPRID